MQILFLAHRIPYPPDKGERIRAFQEVRYLGERHEVDLFCLADSNDAAAEKMHLLRYCRRVHVEVLSKRARTWRAAVNFVTGEPTSFGFFRSPALEELVHQALARTKYDVIFVYSSCMGQFVPVTSSVSVAVDFVDADSQKFLQYAEKSDVFRAFLYRRESRLVARAERELGKRAAATFVVTEHDAREIGGRAAGRRFRAEVVPNGVHVPGDCDRELSRIEERRPFLLFLGTMSYLPNSDAAMYFAKTIFPLVRRNHPEMKFVIAGRDPGREVRELADIPGVVVTGSISDPFAYFRSAECSVAPFRMSQGFHNKIAESLAVGTPVITTKRAQAGIGLSEREGLFVAETPEQFVERLEFVLHPDVRDRVRRNAANVRQLLSWDARLSRMEQLILQASAQPCTAGSGAFA